MGARPYDPSIGRFYAVDPIDGGSLNNYDYAGQDPINNYDLDGTEVCGDPCAAGALTADGTCAVTWEVPGVDVLTCGAGLVLTVAAAAIIVDQDGHVVYNAGKAVVCWIFSCSNSSDISGEDLARIGQDIPGRGHSTAAKQRWNKWFGSLTPKEKQAYKKARGPRPQKRNQ